MTSTIIVMLIDLDGITRLLRYVQEVNTAVVISTAGVGNRLASAVLQQVQEIKEMREASAHNLVVLLA